MTSTLPAVEGRRRPIYATPGAIAAYERLGGSGVLEVEVERSTRPGAGRWLPGRGRPLLSLGADLVVELRSTPARTNPGRSAWLVVGVRRETSRAELEALLEPSRSGKVPAGNLSPATRAALDLSAADKLRRAS